MNYYALSPLGAFIANMILGFYILYRDFKSRLNLLFSLFVFAVAIWALSDFLVMSSSSVEIAYSWGRFGTIGSATMSAFLLHFVLIFTKNKFLSRKKSYVPLLLILYLPGLVFLFVDFTTKLIIEDLIGSDLNYITVVGPLYNLFTLYVIAYIIVGLLVCYNFSKKTTSLVEKKQAKIIILAVSIPTAVGIVTQVAPPFFGLQTIRLTTMITTIMAILIAYAVFKHGLMTSKSFSIRRKLIAGFLIISLLSGAVGYISVTIIQEELQKNIGENSVLLTQQLLDKIDKAIYSKIEEFQAYSNELILQDALIESNQEFGNLSDVQDYINETDLNWTSVSKETITPFMQGLINNRLSEEMKEKIEFYEEKYGYPVFGEIFVTNKYGANVALTGKTSDYRQDDEMWWQNAENDSLYVEDAKYDESAGIYSISICLRIDDEDGDFRGVMKVVLNIEEIINMIEELELSIEYKLTHFSLINKDFKLIYTTEKEYEIFEDVSDEEYVIKAQEGSEGYYICEITGNEELFAYAHSKGYREYKGIGWILTAIYKTEELFVPVTYMINLVIVATCIIVIFGFLCSIIFSQSLSKQIIKLKDAALKISEGNLDAKIEINSKDEIGDLATSFEKMGKSLKKQQDDLENLVVERTKELEIKLDELQRFKKVTVGRELKMIELKKKIKELEGDGKK